MIDHLVAELIEKYRAGRIIVLTIAFVYIGRPRSAKKESTPAPTSVGMKQVYPLPATNAACTLLLPMLANLLPNTPCDLRKLATPAPGVGVGEQGITILRMRVEEHWTPEMLDLKGLEQTMPFRHPVTSGAVEDMYRRLCPLDMLAGGEFGPSTPLVFYGASTPVFR